MSVKSATYAIKIKGLEIKKPLRCDISDSDVIKFIIISETDESGVFYIRFAIKDEYIIDDIKNEKFANDRDKIVINISCFFDEYVSDIRLVQDNISIRKMCTAEILGHVTLESDSQEIEELKEKISNNEDVSVKKSLYRSALTVSDEIARFVLLYSILSLDFDTQKKVDDYIKSKEPNVVMVIGKGRNGEDKEMTIYTKLRNDIAHIRDETVFVETRDEIKRNVTNFAKLIKTTF